MYTVPPVSYDTQNGAPIQRAPIVLSFGIGVAALRNCAIVSWSRSIVGYVDNESFDRVSRFLGDVLYNFHLVALFHFEVWPYTTELKRVKIIRYFMVFM